MVVVVAGGGGGEADGHRWSCDDEFVDLLLLSLSSCSTRDLFLGGYSNFWQFFFLLKAEMGPNPRQRCVLERGIVSCSVD